VAGFFSFEEPLDLLQGLVARQPQGLVQQKHAMNAMTLRSAPLRFLDFFAAHRCTSA